MAAAQQFYPYQQGKGSLMPGQTIVVNKHTIQVERYLSQGKLSRLNPERAHNLKRFSRWFRPRISRQNGNPCVQYNPSCA